MRHAPMLMAALLALATAAGAQELTIVADGASDYQIVLGDGASRSAQLAAEELQSWLAASTGVTLPIVAQADAAAKHLYVGAAAVPAEWGVDLGEVADEGFVVKTVGEDIAFAGVDDGIHPEEIPGTAKPTLCGTMNAVYDFLETQVGVRWYWHDDLGTIVPEHPTLSVPPLNYSQEPEFIYRALPYGPTGEDGGQVATGMWGRRNRLGKSISTYHSHAWFQHLPIEEYADEHPEYYALVNGRRIVRYYSGHHGGQVCTTNPEVIHIFAQACLQYFRTHPDRTMCSVSPNDGGGFCECEDCRALDRAMWPDDGPRAGIPQMADRMLTFYNQIAEVTAQEFPERYLGAYVYSYYALPPLEVRPHPNLALVLAINSAWRGGSPAHWAEDREKIDGWAAIHDYMFMYDIFYHGTAQMGFPAPIVQHTIKYMRHIKELGYRGGYLYIGPTWESLGPGAYLMTKLLWDADADPEPIVAGYYADLYGPAAGDVRAYEELVEGAWVEAMAQEDELAGASAEARYFADKGAGAHMFGVLMAAWEPILSEARAILERAQAAADTDDDRARVQRVVDQFEFTAASIRALHGIARFEQTREPDPAVVAEVKAAIEEREALLEHIGETWSPHFRDWVRANDDRVRSPLRKSAAYFALAGDASRARLTAVRTEEPPVIDGDRSDAIWREAAESGALMRENMGADEAAAPTAVAAAFDDQALYLLLVCVEPEMAEVETPALGPDSPELFRTDNVEVLLDPDGDGSDYFHLAVSAGDTTYDARSADPQTHDVEWTGAWRHAVGRGDDGWAVEIAIPFATLGVPAPAEGERWRANLHRTRRAADPDEYQALSPTLGGYHQPERFGELSFGRAPEATGENILRRWDPERYEAGTDAAEVLRVGGSGEYSVEIADDRAYEGARSIKVTVGADSYATFGWYPASVEPGNYRLAMRYYADPLGAPGEGRPADMPITRIIFRDADGRAVSESSEYSWERSPAEPAEGAWADHIHIFRTLPGTRRFTVTVFVHRPGTYWFDDLSLTRF